MLTNKKIIVTIIKIFRKEAGYSLIEARKLAQLFLKKWHHFNREDLLLKAGFSYEWEYGNGESYKNITGLMKKKWEEDCYNCTFFFTDDIWKMLYLYHDQSR